MDRFFGPNLSETCFVDVKFKNGGDGGVFKSLHVFNVGPQWEGGKDILKIGSHGCPLLCKNLAGIPT